MKPSPEYLHLLQEAASAAGIEPGYWDIWGKQHVTPPEAIQAILQGQGWRAQDEKELGESLRDRRRREWTLLAPPAVVTLESEPRELRVRLPLTASGLEISFEIHREDGQHSTHQIRLAGLKQDAAAEIDGVKVIEVRAPLPGDLPLGYHQVETRCGDLRASTRYIVAPDRAYANPALVSKRAAGFAVTLYGVRSQRNWGCGDFTDLQGLAAWAARALGAGFIALNPLHAIHNRRPFNTSPYLPNCIYYRNPLYLDIEAMEDYQNCERARELRGSPEIAREIEELRASEFVEYERVHALKQRFLKLAFTRFLRERRTRSARAAEFDAYIDREGDLLHRFATYCALDEHLHRRNPDLWVWTNWPVEFQDPGSPAVAEFARRHWRAVMLHKYAQWQLSLQLERAQAATRDAGMPIGLYHDLALATDRFGSDLWAHREFFITGARVGSPPDEFSPKGQDWSFPPPDAERHRHDGYRLFAETIRKNCQPGGALRMDHVMRLFRLFWIPDGAEATGGAYVKELNEDFVRVLALESVRNQVTVVGEDLGTVEPNIREVLSRMGILSYRLMMFEKNADGSFRAPGDYPPQALVSSTTHDLPTLAGFWQGADIEARRAAETIDDDGHRQQWNDRIRDKQRMLDALFSAHLLPEHLPRDANQYPELTSDLQAAIIGFLAGTPSQLFSINQEDLTRERNQQNLPGTTWQYPNWGRKMLWTLEELDSREDVRALAGMARGWVEKTGRS